MSRWTLINEVGEWLIDQALEEPEIVSLFEQVCQRLRAVGVPIARARLTWPTLHPLFQAETVIWKLGEETEFDQFKHQDEVSDEWLQSPMHHMLENNLEVMRRNLDGPNKLVDFPILEELIEQGYSDYLIISTEFSKSIVFGEQKRNGIFVMWASDRPDGFSDDDVAALKKIQRRFAAACKTVVQTRIARNVTETYLGKYAGNQVLDGAIKLGDGQFVQAIVWYCDMRNSTAMADTMPPDQLLDLLNDYFNVTAGPAIEFGGEVLDFIGDAVLAIFPYVDEAGKSQAIRMSTMALEKSQAMAIETNAARKKSGKPEFRYGVGITSGNVMFGNIGVATRLAFTVIGPVVNEVERIESLTKSVDASALVSTDIANLDKEKWVSIGSHRLTGVAKTQELFALKSEQLIALPDADVQRSTSPDVSN